MTEITYKNGVLTDTTNSTVIVKKPDRIKSIISSQSDELLYTRISISNGNTLFSWGTYDMAMPKLIKVIEYVNLLPEMTTYTGYFIERGGEKWKIPMEITDKTKYRVDTTKVIYKGRKAIKAVVTNLVTMSGEELQKQITVGNIPKETVKIFWFDADSLGIIREEYQDNVTFTEVATSIGGKETVGNTIKVEYKVEREYSEFLFDTEIPDSEFEFDPADYPGVEIKREIVDTQDKFK